MNLQSLSNPVHILPLYYPKFTSFDNSASGSCNVTRWVHSSHKNILINSRFNFGYWNVGKRVSESGFRFRNDGGFVRARCEVFERESEKDAYYMRRCVEIARKAIGWTSPNPMVGCVIVKDDKIVGEGFHPKAGQPHAEVFALRDAGELAENATAYVSLEPCNHYGRTPPCSEALINAKLKKVVVGMVDPNPIVSSKGIDRLREAGIEVIVGIEEDLCKKLNEAFIHKMLYGMPFVTIRYSISINGVVLDELEEGAMNCGGYYSKLLHEYDAVIHAPRTTQEFSISASQEPNARQPLHILIAKNVDSPIQILDFPTEVDFKAIVFAEKVVALDLEMAQMGIETVVMDHLSLHAILEYCSRQGLNSILVDLRGNFDGLEEIVEEGFEAKLWQKVVVHVLPFFAGGKGSVSSSSISSATQKRPLKSLSTRTSGGSILLEGYF